MSESKANSVVDEDVRDDWVPKEDYVSPEFAKLEEERLWPRVWQIACREEELKEVGDFVTYDVANESIVLVRATGGEIKAFFNVCMHRGRRLTDGDGSLKQFVCRYHGWRYDLDGRCTRVIDRDDWGACLQDEQIKLGEVRVAVWGGFVFINMSDDAESLEEFLAPIIERCGRYRFDRMNFLWASSIRYPCNWKVYIEGFDEAYHAQQSHPQLMELIKDNNKSRTFGLHGNLYWDIPTASRFGPSDRLTREVDPDHRSYVLAYHKEILEELGAMTSPRTHEAMQRLRTEVPADATPGEVMLKARQFQREAAEADGVEWPDIPPEYAAESGFNWHVFPNVVFQHQGIDSLLFYRVRPDGSDPDSCIIEVWSLMMFGDKAPPPLVKTHYEDWREAKLGRILDQDFVNLHAVQQGMKSRGFKAARTNPVQERSVSNLHRGLRRYMRSAP